jgi:hypothetical protein
MIKGTKKEQDLASILLGLKAQSITSAAKSCGLNPSAVAGWLKGVTGRLSQEKQNILLGYLGISGGTLASDRVHLWTNDNSLEPLREILAWVGEEFEAVFHTRGDGRFGGRIKIVVGLFNPSKSIRILVKQKISPMIADREIQFLDPMAPETIPHVKWLGRDPRENLLPDSSFIEKVLNPKSEILPEEFDRFFKSLNGSRKVEEEIPTRQGKSLTSQELKEILTRAKDWSVDSGVLREDIRTLIEHIESREEK